MQWIYRRSLSNTIGKFTDVLRDQIKEFQADYGLETDGKVGPKTMEAMVNVLNGTLPLPFPYWRPDLSSEQFLGVEDGKAGQEPDLLQTGAASAEPGVIGTDDREAQTNTIKEPNRWVCLLNVKLECRNLIYGSNPITETRCGSVWSLGGTGLLISPRHILTAAHVLEIFSTNKTITNRQSGISLQRSRWRPATMAGLASLAGGVFVSPMTLTRRRDINTSPVIVIFQAKL